MNFVGANTTVLIGVMNDVNYFIMVQMKSCSDHKKLHSSVDLLNLFHWLSFEELEANINHGLLKLLTDTKKQT